MDWSRAKSILIVAFVLLNLLLGYQLWYDRGDATGTAVDTPEAEMAFEQLLAGKNIKLKVPLPQETPKMRELTVRITPADGKPGIIALKQKLPLSLLRDSASYQAAFSKVVPDGESYRFSAVDSANGQYVLFQTQGSYPIFDVRLTLMADAGEITAYRQVHAETVPGGQAEDQKVLSALAAVGILAEKFLPEGANVVDIQLGYHGQTVNSDVRYLAPFWRVVTEQGDRYFVHAITGAVE